MNAEQKKDLMELGGVKLRLDSEGDNLVMDVESRFEKALKTVIATTVVALIWAVAEAATTNSLETLPLSIGLVIVAAVFKILYKESFLLDSSKRVLLHQMRILGWSYEQEVTRLSQVHTLALKPSKGGDGSWLYAICLIGSGGLQVTLLNEISEWKTARELGSKLGEIVGKPFVYGGGQDYLVVSSNTLPPTVEYKGQGYRLSRKRGNMAGWIVVSIFAGALLHFFLAALLQ